MHKTLLKAKNKKLSGLIENIIKKMSKKDILNYVSAEASMLAPQFKDPELVRNLNDDMLDFLSVPVLAGKNKGEPSASVIKVDGAYKALKHLIKTKVKLVKPLDKKSMDALFYLHVYDLALIAFDNKKIRKLLNIKKGFFG
tara:strand:+ start:108 stop:530 length:423 start_codon:yes stop_codon:yes gene_type:complete